MLEWSSKNGHCWRLANFLYRHKRNVFQLRGTDSLLHWWAVFLVAQKDLPSSVEAELHGRWLTVFSLRMTWVCTAGVCGTTMVRLSSVVNSVNNLLTRWCNNHNAVRVMLFLGGREFHHVSWLCLLPFSQKNNEIFSFKNLKTLPRIKKKNRRLQEKLFWFWSWYRTGGLVVC